MKGLDDGVRVAMRVHLLLDEEMDLALPPRSHSSPVLGQVPSRDVSYRSRNKKKVKGYHLCTLKRNSLLLLLQTWDSSP